MKKKPLSDKQWRALLALAARYEKQIPEFLEVARELGIAEEARQLIEKTQESEQREQEDNPHHPVAAELLAGLAEVKDWSPARKNGARVYDDHKFFSSLKRQFEGGRSLSPAQLKALVQLASRYQEQVPALAAVVERHGLNLDEGGTTQVQLSGKEQGEIEALLALSDEIKEWQPPRKVRGRTFDDRDFFASLKRQWQSKGTLSPRQIAALRKSLGKYKKQIAGYDEKAVALGLPGGSESGGQS